MTSFTSLIPSSSCFTLYSISRQLCKNISQVVCPIDQKVNYVRLLTAFIENLDSWPCERLRLAQFSIIHSLVIMRIEVIVCENRPNRKSLTTFRSSWASLDMCMSLQLRISRRFRYWAWVRLGGCSAFVNVPFEWEIKDFCSITCSGYLL